MKKKAAVLLTGIMTASLLLSGCQSSKGIENDNLKISQYKGVEIDEVDKADDVTDKDVTSFIDSVRESNAKTKTIKNRAVKKGDTVTIDFVGKMNGKKFDNGSANNQKLKIGSNTSIEGFEDSIIGHKVGDKFVWNGKFPKNYSEELAGKKVSFTIKVKAIIESKTPELNDAFVKKVSSKSKTVAEYKKEVKKKLEQEAQDQADSSLRSTAWNTVYTNSEVVEYPEKDVEEAVKTFKKQAEAYAKQGNMELEDFVESQGVSMDDFEAQCQQYAQAKVKQNLLIQGIMDAEGMTLEDEESLAIQNQLVEQYASGDLAVLIDTYGQVAVDESIGLMRVQDFIIANANYDQTAADTSAEGEDAQAAEGTEAADHADGSTTDGQSTDGGDTEEEQEAGATADTGTAADASTDTQDDGTEN